MGKLLISAFCALLTTLPGRAQVVEEVSFLAKAAEQMDDYAELCWRNGFPGRAREIWLEVTAEYDADDSVARANLGFVRVGSSWAVRPGYQYPEQDRPQVSSARALQRRWDSLAESLGEGHRALAKELHAAGSEERSVYHSNRALRFLPDDPESLEALGLEHFEGLYGTPDQMNLLRRSRLMEQTVTELAGREFDVEALAPEASHPWLTSVRHHGVRSENFTIWGDFDVDVLRNAASFCERTLAFCEKAFEGYSGFPADKGVVKTLAFFTETDSYETLVRANKNQLGDVADFVLRFADSTTLGSENRRVHLSGHQGVAKVYDMAVRWVAQDYAGFETRVMEEGIGHTIVGRFFGRNLIFGIAPEFNGNRATSSTPPSGQQHRVPLIPDLEFWQDLTRESAWQRTSVPANRLPLVKGSSMTDDVRVKAWSFCDYLLCRDPELLRALDRTPGDGAQDEGQVTRQFREATGVSILELEESWRRFWTEDTPINRAAHHTRIRPLEAVSRLASAWLQAFNDLRAKHGAPEVGWSAAYSAACRQHVESLKANSDQTGDEGGTGNSFVHNAIVSTHGTNARIVMKDWIDLPGIRDAILDQNLHTVGLYVDGSTAVIDVSRGRQRTGETPIQCYPTSQNDADNPVPRSVHVSLLGPEIEHYLKRSGPNARVGYPISIHFYREQVQDVRCSVSATGKPVDGVLHWAHYSDDRRIGARGMWVFYPLEPLHRGVEIKVVWTYRIVGEGPGRYEYAFFAI